MSLFLESTSSISAPACHACRYFHAHHPKGNGDCHRYPPVWVGTASDVERHRWKTPTVAAHNWCGEFVAADLKALDH